MDTTWENVVNFSTINPEKIFQLLKLLGIPYQNSDIFKINIKDLENEDICVYTDLKAKSNREAYEKVTKNSYKELKEIPTKTVKYFADSKDKKEQPLIFAYIPHLIVKGKVNINNAEIIHPQ